MLKGEKPTSRDPVCTVYMTVSWGGGGVMQCNNDCKYYREQVMQHPQGLINLLSYEDAADIVVSALIAGRPEPNPLENPTAGQKIKGHIFLACDDQPTTRHDICEVALGHPFHGWKKMPQFEMTGQCRDQSGAKRLYDSSSTREALGWQPKWASFEEYFDRQIAETRGKMMEEEGATAA